MRSLASTLCSALFAVAVTCSCSDAPKPPPPNIVIIVLDTARPDYLSVYGHPRPTSPYLEQFAKLGTRYDRAYSVSCWTLPAHASLFTGTLPEVHGAGQANTKIQDSLPVLAEQLARAGYQTTGYSANPWIVPETGLARGFQDFKDHVNKQKGDKKNPDSHPTVLGLRDWFAQKRDPTKPFFVFVNLIEPHMPFLPTARTAADFFPSELAFSAAIKALFPNRDPKPIMRRHYARAAPLTDQEWSDMRGLYEGDLLLTDQITEAIMRIVDGQSDPKNTLVFLLSDHGENLGDHGHLSHMFNVYDSNLRILCLARGPGFEPGSVERRLVQIVDVYPTVLKAAGLEVTPHCAGLDLCADLPTMRLLSATLDYPTISLDVFPEEMQKSGVLDPYKRELRAAVSQRYKIIRGSDGSEEIYDLLADPNELSPLAPATLEESLVNGLHGFLDLQAATQAGTTAAPPELPTDPARLKALRDLGYVE